jgi:hypothetical protein
MMLLEQIQEFPDKIHFLRVQFHLQTNLIRRHSQMKVALQTIRPHLDPLTGLGTQEISLH